MLRQSAIQHLRTSNKPVAKGFRAEHLAVVGKKPHQAFLASQGKNGAWGTYIEACALAEQLKVHLVISDGKQTYCLYRAEDKAAPVVHLHNRDNTHWVSASAKETLGDGNCLYNAFAQELQHRALETDLIKPAANVVKTGQSSVASNIEQKAITSQRTIFEAISRKQRPSEMAAEQAAHVEREAALPRQEQQQIAQDYQYALKLALQEALPGSGTASPRWFSPNSKMYAATLHMLPSDTRVRPQLAEELAPSTIAFSS